jgi:hypothetical protein
LWEKKGLLTWLTRNPFLITTSIHKKIQGFFLHLLSQYIQCMAFKSRLQSCAQAIYSINYQKNGQKLYHTNCMTSYWIFFAIFLCIVSFWRWSLFTPWDGMQIMQLLFCPSPKVWPYVATPFFHFVPPPNLGMIQFHFIGNSQVSNQNPKFLASTTLKQIGKKYPQ